MLIIRLQRVGRTNDPSFRVIVTDSKNSAKTGKFLEIVGNYDARQGKPAFKAERIQEWIKNGAQLSDTVRNLLVKNKIIGGETVNVVPIKPAKAAAEVLTAAPKAPAKEEAKEEVKEEVVAEEPIAPAEAEEMIATEEAAAPAEDAVAETPAEETPAEPKAE